MDGSALGYPELLRLAVSKGLQELDITMIQVPAEANGGHAVVLATARTTASLYRALGEAWWSEAGSGRPPQALILAEHRAKTSALCESVGMPRALEAGSDGEAATDTAQRVLHGPTPSAEAKAAPRPLVAPQRDREAVPAAPGPQRTAGGEAVDRAERPAARSTDTGAPRSPVGARPGQRLSASAAEGLGPDVLQQLLQMTRQIGELKHEELTEEEALAKLDSFFMRAFNHPLAEATRVEGQRVVQRLAGDLARLSQDGQPEVAS
jgi:hypothetical protein